MTVWTPERNQLLLQLKQAGHSSKEIAEQLGNVTPNRVRSKLSELNGRPRNYSKERLRVQAYRPNKIDKGDWDAKLFEPWKVRKQRLAHERSRNEMGS